MTDIDGTLLGDPETSLQLRRVLLGHRRRLALQGERLHWVVATGRAPPDAVEVLVEQGFSPSDFDAFVTSVGAEVRFAAEELDTSVADVGYCHRLESSGFDAIAVRAAMAELPFVALQPEHEQHRFKVSYFVADNPAHRAAVAEALAALPFATRTVYCHDDYLDVAPANGTKAGAVEYLLEHWGIDATRAVAAGDSGNDRNMLTCRWAGIVVGNGHAQLADLRRHSSVYFADAKYAAGVLQGLVALGFLSDSEL